MSLIAGLIRARELLEEGVRQYTICNACRYCEGYCPVWPILHSKPLVTHGEVILLANLCYDHRDCYYACPYTPPHEFNINIPRLNRDVRLWTYSELTLNMTKTNWGKVVLALLFLPVIAMWALYWHNIFSPGPINFYKLIPKNTIILAGFTTLAYLLGWALWFIIKFNRFIGPEYRPSPSALLPAIKDLLMHRWFGDMHYPRDWYGNTRLIYHILIFYGFAMDLIATILGAIYEDILHVESPFPLINPTVIIGLIGGLMIITGSLIALHARYVSVKAQRFMAVSAIDVALVIELLLVALTGVLVLIFRSIDNAIATYTMLLIHYTLIYALFITSPLTTTMPHIILRPYTYWIYKSIVK